MATLTAPRPQPVPHLRNPSFTPEDFLAMEDAVAFEMRDDGSLLERSMGMRADEVSGFVYFELTAFVYTRGLGVVFLASTGLQIFPARPYRIPRADVGYISKGRLPGGEAYEGHLRSVPELLVEVVSPNDTLEDVEAKVAEYLAAGVSLVWVVKPGSRTVDIWRADGSFARVTEQDTIVGDEVLPGFAVPVSRFFARL